MNASLTNSVIISLEDRLWKLWISFGVMCKWLLFTLWLLSFSSQYSKSQQMIKSIMVSIWNHYSIDLFIDDREFVIMRKDYQSNHCHAITFQIILYSSAQNTFWFKSINSENPVAIWVGTIRSQRYLKLQSLWNQKHKKWSVIANCHSGIQSGEAKTKPFIRTRS